MGNTQDIHAFALRWIEIFDNSETVESEISLLFGEECAEMDFDMDLGKSFNDTFSKGKAFINPDTFSDIVSMITDVGFLACAIYSKWRVLTFVWRMNLLEPRNRIWFKFALMRLAELTEPEDEEETYECFRGIAERIYLESNNICFGPCPAPDEEVE